MLSNFFEYVLNFGMYVWNGICFLGESMFTITSNTITLSFKDFIDNLTNLSFLYQNNPFREYFVSLGLDTSNIFDLLVGITGVINAITQTIYFGINSVLSLIGLNFPMNNFILVITYFMVLSGTFILGLRIFSRLFRLVKDLFNPLN